MAATAEDIENMESMEERQASEEQRVREQFQSIVGRLEREAEDRVQKRSIIEQRWLEDLSQYHGRYEEKVAQDLRESKKSALFINSTRPKTNAMEARLSDMLFPTDDRNWGIGPTPVPELTVGAEQTARKAAQAATMAANNPEDPVAQQEAANARSELAIVQHRMDEAKKRARAMEEEIDDHLRGCFYGIQAREVIRDACKIGTGIMKGPIVGDRARLAWRQDPATGEWGMTPVSESRPVFWRVDPWNFFPDMDAKGIEECEGNYERHLLNPKEIRRLGLRPGFDKDALRRLLMQSPQMQIPSYLSDLRSITGAYQDTSSKRYHVWEYHGPLDREDLQTLVSVLQKEDMLEDLEDIDPLTELEVVVWFCQGEVLKFGIHHLDSNESIYSVFNLEGDEACIFGFGIPAIMRDPQKAMAAAWRALMDNAGLSSGPQIVINKDIVTPADGVWKIEPRKVWFRKTGAPKGEKPFEVFEIRSNLEELSGIIELCKRNIDDETNLPVIAQGEQGAHVTKTAQGMGILMNSVNVVFRRVIKNWDDGMTVPNIRRMYDYLMQFSDKEEIKGDYEVDARGTSVLLVREMQSANLMAFLLQFSGHPVLGKYLKDEGVKGLRRLSQTMMIPADEMVMTDDDIADLEAKTANDPPVPDPEMEKITASLNLERIRGENALALEEARRETHLIEVAARNNMEVEKLKAMLFKGKQELDSKERIFAAEAAMEAEKDARGDTSGSGGYL